MKKRLVGFGEIMVRFAPEGALRFAQVLPGRMNVTFGGAESNVCGAVALLGGAASFVTVLPRNPLADACVAFLRSLGVGTDRIIRTEAGRIGLYFLETGANQRPSNVIYDRAGSAIALAPPAAYDWDAILSGAGWFHISGITPALSAHAAAAALAAVQAAKARGITVSCDLNFRKKLWNWDPRLKPRELAETTMRGILPFADVVIANEEDAADVLGIHAGGSDAASGRLDVARYPEVAAGIVAQFPNVSRVAITLRESFSATWNNWGAMLYDAPAAAAYFAPERDGRYAPYEIRAIVDRVGGGDAFAAGLVYALMDAELASPSRAVAFAAAASCLAHSISGDTNHVSRAEVEALMSGAASGRVVR